VAKQPVVRELQVATGVALSHLEQGDPSGPAILLLHPWGESLRCFDRLIALMPPSFRVLSLDQRGHGGAEHRPAVTSSRRSRRTSKPSWMQLR
jgi:pimeloyl-ACP methyl ester carboxylesterase